MGEDEKRRILSERAALMAEKKRIAIVFSVLVFLAFMCGGFWWSDGINHYWVDESEGPTMVKYERPYLQRISMWGMLLASGVIVGLAAYGACRPTRGWV